MNQQRVYLTPSTTSTCHVHPPPVDFNSVISFLLVPCSRLKVNQCRFTSSISVSCWFFRRLVAVSEERNSWTLMNASGAQYQTNPRCMRHYLWPPTEVVSASESSSPQVSWKFIHHATRFRFMWRKHPLAFLVEITHSTTRRSQIRCLGSGLGLSSLFPCDVGLMVTKKKALWQC